MNRCPLAHAFISDAVGHCQSLIREPRNTISVLISDLCGGGFEAQLLSLGGSDW
jgi:hypothetical protein